VPYIDYINDYISYFKDKQAKNEKLLYLKNLKKIANLSRLSDYGVWLICIILAITYSLTTDNYGQIWLKTKTGETIDEYVI